MPFTADANKKALLSLYITVMGRDTFLNTVFLFAFDSFYTASPPSYFIFPRLTSMEQQEHFAAGISNTFSPMLLFTKQFPTTLF